MRKKLVFVLLLFVICCSAVVCFRLYIGFGRTTQRVRDLETIERLLGLTVPPALSFDGVLLYGKDLLMVGYFDLSPSDAAAFVSGNGISLSDDIDLELNREIEKLFRDFRKLPSLRAGVTVPSEFRVRYFHGALPYLMLGDLGDRQRVYFYTIAKTSLIADI